MLTNEHIIMTTQSTNHSGKNRTARWYWRAKLRLLLFNYILNSQDLVIENRLKYPSIKIGMPVMEEIKWFNVIPRISEKKSEVPETAL
ncbi:hypothetical protein TrispH2_005921 [Trichoplax sp. H2]|nr:hypothetical protein TrispH2_005921 [Trichoplax sp. H2]|eukprot:RDD41132.1 hypothetical protein TrispH2_005921 [Trichoplax sp. H2]